MPQVCTLSLFYTLVVNVFSSTGSLLFYVIASVFEIWIAMPWHILWDK